MQASIPGPDDLAVKLIALLRAHGLPENTRSFTVHCDLDGLVVVECEFLPFAEPQTA